MYPCQLRGRIQMGYYVVLLCLAFVIPASSQNCEPSASTRKVLEQLEIPDDVRQPAAHRQELKLELLRKGISGAPADIHLHEAYQAIRLGKTAIDRPVIIAEYKQLLAKNPNDPTFLYLVANAQIGRETKEAIGNLERATELAPDFGLPHLVLAQIYLARAYEDSGAMRRHLERFVALCPTSVRTLPALRWSQDKELIAREATRLRKNIEARRDSEAVAAYPTLWNLEAALERSDLQAQKQTQMNRDIDRLFGSEFARNSAWLNTLRATRYFDGVPEEVSRKAQRELAVLFHDSDAAVSEEYKKATEDLQYPEDGTPEQITAYSKQMWHRLLPIVRKWPATIWLADIAARSVTEDRSATPKEVTEVINLFKNAVQQDPDGYPTLPPEPIAIAQRLVERGGPFDNVSDLVLAGFRQADRVWGIDAANDVTGTTAASLSQSRDTWYVMGYLPLAEAHIHMDRLSSANNALSQADTKLNAIRPREGATSAEKARFAVLAAPYWFIRGLYTEKIGRKMDALVDYRNAVALYPPRRPSPDRRDEAMASAERLWKDLGGTAQGWNDWATQSSLASFYGGSGSTEAWSKIAKSSPDLILTDVLGNRWDPQDLAKRTTFVTMWASWCAPCRAELPYVEKLYQHFRTRSDVAILAFNLDDDPKAMTTALRELKLTIPSIAAHDFAYSIVPEMALPANWLITSRKTEMFLEDGNSHEEWLNNATAAIEKAAAQK